MKKILSILLAAVLTMSMLAGCGNSTPDTPAEEPAPAETEAPAAEPAEEPAEEAEAPAEGATITVAAIETAYGSDMWKEVCDAFTAQTGIAVELITDKNLEDVIGPSM